MAEKTNEEVASTQKSLQSNHDPGWNDPPKWAFTATSTSSSATPTKRLLNKRVAFPLSSTSAAAPPSSMLPGQLPPSNLPPPPAQLTHLTSAPHAPLLAPTGVSTNEANITPIVNKEEALSKTIENLETVINTELDSSKVEEVRKRLEVMKSMWSEDKLNDKIQGNVLKISEALRDKDIEAADKLHVSLMMEHTALCNAWISGIRHLILELREKNTHCETQDNNSQSIFLLNPAESQQT